MTSIILAAIIAIAPPGMTKAESREGALVRYERIAEVAEGVTRDRRHVLPFLLTVMLFESRYRLDVHSGALRGDCKLTKKGRRIPGTCKSICLTQIRKTRRNWKSSRGYSHESLAGTSRIATFRCLVTAADFLEQMHKRCHGGAQCVFGNYIGAKRANENKDVRRRVQALWSVRKRLGMK